MCSVKKTSSFEHNIEKKYFIMSIILLIIYLVLYTIWPTVWLGKIEMLCFFIMLFCLLVFIFIDRNKLKYKTLLQLFTIVGLFAFFWDSSLLSPATNKLEHIKITIIGTILINTLLLEIAILVIKNWDYKINYKQVILLSGIFVVFFIANFGLLETSFCVDGSTYYKEVRRISQWDYYGFSNLKLAGHVSYSYSILLLIGEFLMPNNVIGVRLIHIIMAYISIYAFSKILEKIKMNKYNAVIALIGFSFSPILFGTCMEINVDYGLFCFFIWFVSSYVCNNYILQAFCGLAICFSKETGCVLFAGFLFGILIKEILAKGIKFKKILKCICSKKIILNGYVGLLWLLVFIFGNKEYGWLSLTDSNEVQSTGIQLNTFTFNLSYIIYKLKEILFINWGWLLLGTTIVLVIISLIRKNKLKKQFPLLELLTSCLFYVIISILYFTWPHYRYINLFNFYYIIMLFYTIEYVISNLHIKKVMMIFFSCIIISSSYFSWDPLMAKNFITYDTDGGKIAILGTLTKEEEKYVINDNDIYQTTLDTASLYNNQMTYFKKALNISFSKIEYNSNILIVIPRQMRDSYGTLASIFGSYPQRVDKMYWDSQKEILELNLVDDLQENSRYKIVNIVCINDINELNDEIMNQYEEIYFWGIEFSPEINSESILKQTENDYPIIDTVKTIGWSWDIYQLK